MNWDDGERNPSGPLDPLVVVLIAYGIAVFVAGNYVLLGWLIAAVDWLLFSH